MVDFKEELTSIKKAAAYVNSMLQAKGFIDTEQPRASQLNSSVLMFPSVDYRHLMNFDLKSILSSVINKDSGSNDNNEEESDSKVYAEATSEIKRTVILNETLLNNDKNVINIIFSLLRNLDSAKTQKEEFLQTLSDRDAQIRTLRLENRQLARKASALETANHAHSLDLKLARQRLEEEKVRAADLQASFSRSQSAIKSLKAVSQVELRRKDVEISALKDRLLNKNTHMPMTAGSALQISGSLNIDDNGSEENSNPMELPAVNKFSRETLHSVVDAEVQKLMVDSSDLITNLTLANRNTLKTLSQAKQYLSVLTQYLLLATESANDNEVMAAILEEQTPPRPESFFNDEEPNHLVPAISSSDPANTTVEVTNTLVDLGTTGALKKQLADNLAALHALVQTLLQRSAQGGTKHTEELEETVQALQKELKVAKASWQNAIQTMEKWRAYREDGAVSG